MRYERGPYAKYCRVHENIRIFHPCLVHYYDNNEHYPFSPVRMRLFLLQLNRRGLGRLRGCGGFDHFKNSITGHTFDHHHHHQPLDTAKKLPENTQTFGNKEFLVSR